MVPLKILQVCLRKLKIFRLFGLFYTDGIKIVFKNLFGLAQPRFGSLGFFSQFFKFGFRFQQFVYEFPALLGFRSECFKVFPYALLF